MKELIKMGTSGLYLDFSQHKKRNFVVVLCFLQLVLILMSNFIIVNKLFNEMKEFSKKWSKYRNNSSLWTNFFQFFRWLAARLRDKLTNQKTAFNPWSMAHGSKDGSNFWQKFIDPPGGSHHPLSLLRRTELNKIYRPLSVSHDPCFKRHFETETEWIIVCLYFIIILEYCESHPLSQFQIWIVDSLLRSWLFS